MEESGSRYGLINGYGSRSRRPKNIGTGSDTLSWGNASCFVFETANKTGQLYSEGNFVLVLRNQKLCSTIHLFYNTPAAGNRHRLFSPLCKTSKSRALVSMFCKNSAISLNPKPQIEKSNHSAYPVKESRYLF
jgi:hypothetical protein